MQWHCKKSVTEKTTEVWEWGVLQKDNKNPNWPFTI
jgi:hypothetical protein